MEDMAGEEACTEGDEQAYDFLRLHPERTLPSYGIRDGDRIHLLNHRVGCLLLLLLLLRIRIRIIRIIRITITTVVLLIVKVLSSHS